MQKVIARRVNVNVVDNEGNNCLHLALHKDAFFHSEVEPMAILDTCAFKLSLDLKDRTCNVVVASSLFHFGANFYQKNMENKTPVDLIMDENLKEKLTAILPPLCTYCKTNFASKFQPCQHSVLCSECQICITCETCPTCQQPVFGPGEFESQKLDGKLLHGAAKKLGSQWQQVDAPTFGKFTKLSQPKPSTSQPKPSASQPDESLNLGKEHLHNVAKNIGIKWQQVGRELGIRQADLDIIRHDYPYNVVEQTFQMLHKWFQSCDPAKRTLGTLKEALTEMECFNALEHLSSDVN
ncbi:uncharacterized protein LOC106878359 [Octopus bimaculoides]|uniref:Death domain-containing protein n=1 Tax=Octopus bimaculoides TaxID=37653 RepID=A0A0L8G944_OCTBM|nr:uncharacterized protein LOC106878359 [Octopus bimaculoides]